MKNILFVFLVMLGCVSELSAQVVEEEISHKVDSVMRAIPAEYTFSSDNIVKYIKSHFNDEKDVILGIYVWIAKNIKYDTEDKSEIAPWQNSGNIVSYTLKNKKGVCDNFSALFLDLCKKTGITAYTISGYIRQGGSVEENISHSWNVAYVGGVWRMFDATLGVVYLDEANKGKVLGYTYFMVDPYDMLKTHMPFDYMWQFVDHTITYDQFAAGEQPQDDTPFYNFADSINYYNKLDITRQLTQTAARMKRNGSINYITGKRLEYINSSIKYYSRQVNIELYEKAKESYNGAIAHYNEFVRLARQNQGSAAGSALKKSSANINDAFSFIKKIKGPDADIADAVSQLNGVLEELRARITEYQKKYH